MLSKFGYCHAPVKHNIISEDSFDEMLQNLKHLSPMQLLLLQEQIQDSLKQSETPLLTTEELDTIASLFQR